MQKENNIDQEVEEIETTYTEEDFDVMSRDRLLYESNFSDDEDLSLSNIFDMNSTDISMTLEELDSLEFKEMKSLNKYLKKQKETLSDEQYSRIAGYATGMCISLGTTCPEVEKFKAEEGIAPATKEFEYSPAIGPFMSLRTERDTIRMQNGKDIPETPSFEELRQQEIEKQEELLKKEISEEESTIEEPTIDEKSATKVDEIYEGSEPQIDNTIETVPEEPIIEEESIALDI